MLNARVRSFNCSDDILTEEWESILQSSEIREILAISDENYSRLARCHGATSYPIATGTTVEFRKIESGGGRKFRIN